jgi:hypothetical protein
LKLHSQENSAGPLFFLSSVLILAPVFLEKKPFLAYFGIFKFNQSPAAMIGMFFRGSLLLCLFATIATAQMPDTSSRPRPFMVEPSSGNPYGIAEDQIRAAQKKAGRNSNLNWNNLPYFMDDLMLVGGLNRTGIHYSNHFRQLRVDNGFNLGFENYVPMLPKAFLHYGLFFNHASIRYTATDDRNGTIKLNKLDIPVFMAYELPVFRQFDWRFFLGAQVSYRIGGASVNLPPAEGITTMPIVSAFDPTRFQRFDLGMNFGLSMEYNSWYGRIRNFTGTRKLDVNDTGMLNSWHIEVGYFLFRNLRGGRK